MINLFKKKEERKCNHNPNHLLSSLKQTSKKTMVNPEQGGFYCPLCGKTFIFSKDADGLYQQIKKG